MKIVELKRVKKEKVGRINLNGIKPESQERKTMKLLSRYGLKAAKQAGYVVFDLRNVKKNPDKVEKYIIELFTGNSRMRRMILIRKDGRAIDLLK